jgi:LacI family transcriptional regulator
MARASVNLLLALIAGLEAPSEQIVLPTQLIVRESTTPLKAKRKKEEAAKVGVASAGTANLAR